MQFPQSITDVATLTEYGRQRLSEHFFMREMLYSEVGNLHGVPNIPENPELALQVGCEVASRLLEPLKRAFGHVSIRSAYRSPVLNAFCNERFRAGDTACWCTDNDINAARHIWDRRDSDGHLGGTVTVFIPAYLEHYRKTEDYRPLAWWIRDHIDDYAELFFFRNLCAFNIRWYQGPSEKAIWYLDPPTRSMLTKMGTDGFNGDHGQFYRSIIKPLG
jgi:hypothetical protein